MEVWILHKQARTHFLFQETVFPFLEKTEKKYQWNTAGIILDQRHQNKGLSPVICSAEGENRNCADMIPFIIIIYFF